MLKSFFNWLKSTGKGSATKQRELDEANAAPYKLEAPVAPIVDSPVVVAEAPVEVKPETKPEVPTKAKAPRKPRAAKTEITEAKPKAPAKPRAPKKSVAK